MRRFRYASDARDKWPGVETLQVRQMVRALVSAVATPDDFWIQLVDVALDGAHSLRVPEKLARLESALQADVAAFETMRECLVRPYAACAAYDSLSRKSAPTISPLFLHSYTNMYIYEKCSENAISSTECTRIPCDSI